jgi:hypothetical protein
MSQAEVLEFLESERKISDKWFTSVEIKKKFKELNKSGINGIYDDLYKLASFREIEWKGEGLWKHRKKFRGIKKEKKEDKS